MKNNKMLKPLALILCAVILTGCLGLGVAYAVTDSAGAGNSAAKAAPAAKAANAPSSPANGELIKDETVYVLAGADGSVQKVIVSDWIKNGTRSESVEDKTDLNEVETIRGGESYTMSGENMRVWDAAGSDIYYQGGTDKPLPVSVSVSYKLDGRSIEPESLAGKSGRVTIRFDYTNNEYELTEIDGEREKIYVPFAMLTGLLLDNEKFTNIEVSNGKLINDGERTIVAGVAFPGMQESLKLDADKLELPDYVEISADTVGFELDNTVTIATTELFSQLNEKKDDAKGALSGLTDAMGELADGSSELYDGLCTLLEKSNELVSGINRLADGAGRLQSGSAELGNGAQELANGAAALYEGLGTLANNNAALSAGATDVFNSLLAMANKQLSAGGLPVPALTIENYADVLNDAIASIDSSAVYATALATVTAAVEEQRGYINQQVTAAVQQEVAARVEAAAKEQVEAQVTAGVQDAVTEQVIDAVTKLDKETYEQAVEAGQISEEAQEQIAAAVEAQMGSEAVQAQIAALTEQNMGSEAVKEQIAANTEAQLNSEEVAQLIAENTELQVQKAISDNMSSAAVQSQLAAAAEGAKAVIALKASLDSYNAFYLGLNTYLSGVVTARDGASSLSGGAAQLKAGSDELSAGAGTLYNGVLTLKNNTPALIDGITQLRDGAMQLSDALAMFDMERLTDASGDPTGLAARVKAVADAASRYEIFSAVSDTMRGEVRFIYRTESIEANG